MEADLLKGGEGKADLLTGGEGEADLVTARGEGGETVLNIFLSNPLTLSLVESFIESEVPHLRLFLVKIMMPLKRWVATENVLTLKRSTRQTSLRERITNYRCIKPTPRASSASTTCSCTLLTHR